MFFLSLVLISSGRDTFPISVHRLASLVNIQIQLSIDVDISAGVWLRYSLTSTGKFTSVDRFVELVRYHSRTFFHCLVFLLTISNQQCSGLIAGEPECRPVDIQLYTWSGPGYDSGECWHQGHRLTNGATWGRMDAPGSPYCVCEKGRVRIFYSQQGALAADALTLLRPIHGAMPTFNDLAKWPIPNYRLVRKRFVVCSSARLGRRIRSRDGCVACKCSTNGHWLCRRARPSIANATHDEQVQRPAR